MRKRPQTGATTRQRSVSLTDQEWTRVGQLAREHGVSRSRYVADRVTDPDTLASGCANLSDIAIVAEVHRQFDALLAHLPEETGQIDLLAVLAQLDRIDRRLKRLACGADA